MDTDVDSHSFAPTVDPKHGDVSVSSFGADRKVSELERAKTGQCQPGNKATETQMKLAVLELERRINNIEQASSGELDFGFVYSLLRMRSKNKNIISKKMGFPLHPALAAPAADTAQGVFQDVAANRTIKYAASGGGIKTTSRWRRCGSRSKSLSKPGLLRTSQRL